MRIILCILISFAIGCQKDGSTELGPIRTEAAVIYANMLPVDGCEEHVRLDTRDSTAADIRYKPTASSLPILQKALGDISVHSTTFERAVTIRFAETGQQVDLICGWGSRSKVNEIEIVSISER